MYQTKTFVSVTGQWSPQQVTGVWSASNHTIQKWHPMTCETYIGGKAASKNVHCSSKS